MKPRAIVSALGGGRIDGEALRQVLLMAPIDREPRRRAGGSIHFRRHVVQVTLMGPDMDPLAAWLVELYRRKNQYNPGYLDAFFPLRFRPALARVGDDRRLLFVEGNFFEWFLHLY